MSQQSTPTAPWYKQPWLWFVLSPIIAAMTVGFIMLSVAIGQQRIDPPLDRESKRDGRGYVLDTSHLENAEARGISATLVLDSLTGQALVNVEGDIEEELSMIELHVKVGANQQRDHVIKLNRVGTLNSFNGNMDSLIATRSTFILIPELGDWHLRQDAYPPFDEKTIVFQP
ncbi:hypothetical protein DN062_12045 [Nitrincola tibetensis]|uniref:Nitrogen fixation protein FixH n=1 Tax=Nitrincola tibetensis TaxID=2219697 RepID=A0A364NKX7_9GAMM|nr:FixH family protein [Nitrincola tibetensis]RAU17722.1 hypothetical protein DN062_12045 [Nitrincola tibetensis]